MFSGVPWLTLAPQKKDAMLCDVLKYTLQSEGSERTHYNTTFLTVSGSASASCPLMLFLTYPSLALTPSLCSSLPGLCRSTGSGVLRLSSRCKHTAGQRTAGLSAAHMPLRAMHHARWRAASILGFRLNPTTVIYCSCFFPEPNSRLYCGLVRSSKSRVGQLSNHTFVVRTFWKKKKKWRLRGGGILLGVILKVSAEGEL